MRRTTGLRRRGSAVRGEMASSIVTRHSSGRNSARPECPAWSAHVWSDVVGDRAKLGVGERQLAEGCPGLARHQVDAAGSVGPVEDAIEADLAHALGEEIGLVHRNAEAEAGDARDVEVEPFGAR